MHGHTGRPARRAGLLQPALGGSRQGSTGFAGGIRLEGVETTYEEAHAHLGIETQRQWSDPAIFRTTPVLLGLYSVVTLYVHQNAERLALSPRRAAWYPKPAPTFADAIARLRQHLWFERIVISAENADMTQPLPPAMQSLIEAACYAQ